MKEQEINRLAERIYRMAETFGDVEMAREYRELSQYISDYADSYLDDGEYPDEASVLEDAETWIMKYRHCCHT